MCISFFYLPSIGSNKPFILTFNRDEKLEKLTASLSPFEEDSNIIAGRDLEGKGTWCGVNKQTGVVAFLTNYDSPKFQIICDIKYGRGNLPYRFLKSDFQNKKGTTLEECIYSELESILKEINRYNAFNLIVGSIHSRIFYYICNPYGSEIIVTPEPRLLHHEVCYSLCNTDIDGDWKKMKSGKEKFQKIIDKDLNSEELFKELNQLMEDNKKFVEDEASESSIFIEQYFNKEMQLNRGTLSSCFLSIDSKEGHIMERFYIKQHNNKMFQDKNNPTVQSFSWKIE